MVEKEDLAREAFNFLSKVPESADLRTVCKRFEDLRFYEAVVRLALQKAQALDPVDDALNEQIDPVIPECALAQHEQCYEIIANALRTLKGATPQMEFDMSGNAYFASYAGDADSSIERLVSGAEAVGDEDVARALLAACRGAIQPVLNAYDQLLSNGAILPSPNLRLRLLRSE
ncbi:hypothetical protein RJ641_003430 [Dillenia turbinata]|uniref:Nucleoporin Nup133/Nup155-like C-terminal domain-containing protein n=1 Tax=Dillenia turbinata TaxID=194707 RepID=A0AAN8ZBD8_9MAGN